MSTLTIWAAAWGVPPVAMDDLRRRLAVDTDPHTTRAPAGSEAAVQTAERLDASHRGGRLWRNNVGAVTMESGGQLRYGLANDSKQLNARVKSSDLIGITPLLIRPEHVGQSVGVFTAVECKRAAWVYKATARERAQLKYIELVLSLGGRARFSNGKGLV